MTSHTFFAHKGSLKEAFPDVATFQATLKRTDFHNLSEETFYLDASNAGEDFKCPGRLCRGGKVDIGTALRDMLSAKETQRRFKHWCEHPCRAGWEITMDVTYKP